MPIKRFANKIFLSRRIYAYLFFATCMMLLASGSLFVIVTKRTLNQEQVTIERIYARGGHVNCEPRSPHWMSLLFGDEWKSVTYVFVENSKFNDADAQSVGGFLELDAINIGRSEVTGEGLKAISQSPGLNSLSMESLNLGPKGLEYVAGAKSLRTLYLSGTKVTSRDVQQLSSLVNLVDLDLTQSGVIDDAMAYISTMRGLTTLSISYNNISDAGVIQLSKLSNVRSLDLSGTNVSDLCVPVLSKLKDMNDLRLRKTEITDASIVEFGRMTKLKHLDINGTKVTNQGVERLSSKLPLCNIEYQ